jgi:peptidoglycan/LPS O-acetylase OafA/YrhL
MGICPQCNQEVSARAILFPSALGGVVCRHCRASLESDGRSRALLGVLAIGAMVGAHFVVGEARPVWMRLPAELGAALAVSLALAGRVTRLRLKRPSIPSLRPGGSSGGF